MNNSARSQTQKSLRKMSRTHFEEETIRGALTIPDAAHKYEDVFVKFTAPTVATIVVLDKRGQPHGETAIADAARNGIRG
jgi:hypothetical protein